ncbi:24-dehydrocholesterol reductase-like protein precursor [Apiospora arundinis]|uniref:Delta(24)-sterol reductase n=1 Tax=Apiospora arundinis TaxID=335852 RepID=A0ABR2JFZ2_9PEZI
MECVKDFELHELDVRRIQDEVQDSYRRKQPYHIFHGSTNSTRPAHNDTVVDISCLRRILKIDPYLQTALVEPTVPMDKLVEATLEVGLMPPVVMEFPGITVGGGFSGSAGGSSSFKSGYFSETVREIEIVRADGEVCRASASKNTDLFHGAAGAAGTLGIITLLELRLIPAEMFSGPWDPWFYMHVRERVQTRLETGAEGMVDYIPLREYLFRYDRGAFWVGRECFKCFGFVPFNSLTRWFLDDFMHTRMLYRALHASNSSFKFMIQDLSLPYSKAQAFVEYTADKIEIWPLWLCPLRATQGPTFHPSSNRQGDPKTSPEPMLNIGLWGRASQDLITFVEQNRDLERRVRDLDGCKVLYSHTYYTEQEFWDLYDRTGYDKLRERYRATTLPSIYEKVNVGVYLSELQGKQSWSEWLWSSWPLPGITGIVAAVRSGDYVYHRQLIWRRLWERGVQDKLD